MESAEDQTVRFPGYQESGGSQEAELCEDARLLAVMADGDQHALATLYRRRGSLIFSLLVRILVDEMEAKSCKILLSESGGACTSMIRTVLPRWLG